MKKLTLAALIVFIPAIASANYLFGNYNMTLNPIVAMNLTGMGLFAASQLLRQIVAENQKK